MSEVSIVAKRLKEARLRAGLSQKQLGIRAGIENSPQGYHLYYQSRRQQTPAFALLVEGPALSRGAVASRSRKK